MKKLVVIFVLMAFAASPALAALQNELGILDISGTNPATGEAWKHCDSYRLVFITNTAMYPDSNDITFYNDLVQTEANASTKNLGSVVWNVIGSTDSVDARDNTLTNPGIAGGHDGSIFLVDGSTVVAYDNADLWDGEVAHIIDQDPNGNPPTEAPHTGEYPYTGTYWDGTAATGHDGSWNAFGGGDNVQQAHNTNTDTWVWRSWYGDTADQPFYAMSEPLYVTDSTLDFVNKPTFQAGVDMISWLDTATQMDPNIISYDTSKTLTYQWSAPNLDPNLVVTFDPSATAEAPTVRISKVAGEEVSYPATVEIELAMNYVETANTVSDVTHSIAIDVYEDGCTAAQSIGDVTFEKTDYNEDCVTDIADLAEFAKGWLKTAGLDAPQPK